jgi:hypothetical protein
MDSYYDAGSISAGGGQVIVKRGQQHVSAVFQPGYCTLADPELAGDLQLGHLRRFADHRQVHCIDPVHLFGLGVGLRHVSGDLRV